MHVACCMLLLGCLQSHVACCMLHVTCCTWVQIRMGGMQGDNAVLMIPPHVSFVLERKAYLSTVPPARAAWSALGPRTFVRWKPHTRTRTHRDINVPTCVPARTPARREPRTRAHTHRRASVPPQCASDLPSKWAINSPKPFIRLPMGMGCATQRPIRP